MPDPTNSALTRFNLTLPVGCSIKGKVIDTFEVGAVRGSLRRQLLNCGTRAPAFQQMVAIRHVISDIGGLGQAPEAVFRKLTLPDVEYINLVVAAREQGHIPCTLTCDPQTGGCGHTEEAKIDARSVGVIEGSAPVEMTDDGFACQEVIFRPFGSDTEITAKFRVTTLGDQIAMYERLMRRSKQGDAPFGDLTFEQMSRTMIDYDGRGSGLSMEELDDLPYKTFAALQDAANSVHPTSVDTDVEFHCPQCGHTTTSDLPLDGWLVPFDQRGADSQR